MAGLVLESARLQDGVGQAIYDEQRIYRYWLSRVWDACRSRVCWIMLNPSTATAAANDRTIARVMGFSKAWGHGSMTVVNLFAFRARWPVSLARVGDPVGPRNNAWILEAASWAACMVAAWGNHGTIINPATGAPRHEEVQSLLASAGVEPTCMAVTARGQPGHPLYLPASAKTVPYRQSAASSPARIS
jgi:hypothetical protein